MVSKEIEVGQKKCGGGDSFSILIDAKQKQLGVGLVLAGFGFSAK